MSTRKTRIVANDLRKYVGRVRRALAEELVRILKETTPVDTHHAESNWIASLGRPYPDVAGSREKVDFGPQERGLVEVRTEPTNSLRVANVVNNVPYIEVLNDGWSQQAPTGFVQAAIAQAKANVRLIIGRLARAK